MQRCLQQRTRVEISYRVPRSYGRRRGTCHPVLPRRAAVLSECAYHRVKLAIAGYAPGASGNSRACLLCHTAFERTERRTGRCCEVLSPGIRYGPSAPPALLPRRIDPALAPRVRSSGICCQLPWALERSMATCNFVALAGRGPVAALSEVARRWPMTGCATHGENRPNAVPSLHVYMSCPPDWLPEGQFFFKNICQARTNVLRIFFCIIAGLSLWALPVRTRPKESGASYAGLHTSVAATIFTDSSYRITLGSQ